MEYRTLGTSNLKVSSLCLGTMTWGKQNTEEEAHQQLDYAHERGINFIDTAELYPVPPEKKTYSLTEQYIGNWSKLKTNRENIVLGTKVAGPGEWVQYMRKGQVRLDKENIITALENSLRRLKVDYIDLYQLHWPNRNTNFFGKLGHTHLEKEEDFIHPLETLEALDLLVEQGKIKYIGVSNESPWGILKYLEASKINDMPKIVSIQNPYNLLNRSYEIGMAEISIRENVKLLAYSPLAFGTLTGKYLNGKQENGARLTLYKQFNRYTNPKGVIATEAYEKIAKKYNLSFTQMSLAFVTNRPFVISNIIGATKISQLKENIDSAVLKLSPEVLNEINLVHAEISNPCP